MELQLLRKQLHPLPRRLRSRSSQLPLPESSVTDGEKKEAEAEDSNVGWVSRIAQLEGVDPARMSTLHGRVIASAT